MVLSLFLYFLCKRPYPTIKGWMHTSCVWEKKEKSSPNKSPKITKNFLRHKTWRIPPKKKKKKKDTQTHTHTYNLINLTWFNDLRALARFSRPSTVFSAISAFSTGIYIFIFYFYIFLIFFFLLVLPIESCAQIAQQCPKVRGARRRATKGGRG